MADYDNRVFRGQAGAVAGIDAGLRAHMLRIYNYMLVGLVLTGTAAFGGYSLAVTTDASPAAARLPRCSTDELGASAVQRAASGSRFWVRSALCCSSASASTR